jgi:hypothetical protein
MTLTQYQIIPSRFGYPLSVRPRTPTWTPPVFNTKNHKTDFRGRKKRCVPRDPGCEFVRFVTQTTPQVGNDSARGGDRQHHNRAGQGRGVGNGTPQHVFCYLSVVPQANAIPRND